MPTRITVDATITNPVVEIDYSFGQFFFNFFLTDRQSDSLEFENGFGLTGAATGSGFTYSSNGSINGGTITSIQFFWLGNPTVLVEDIAWQVADITDAVIAEIDDNVVDAVENFLYSQDFIYISQGPDQIETLLPGTVGEQNVPFNLRGNDLFNLGGGDDAFFLGDGNDTGNGGTGADTLWGGNGADVLNGQAGNDRLIGNGGNDRGFGGNGNDTMIGGFGGDRLVGQAGNDRLIGNAGNDTLLGGNGRDVLLGQGGNDRVIGNGGNDTVNGGGGNDLVSGQAGADQVIGGAGNDTLFGGAGADILRGGNGADEINGGNGNDQIFGGGGPDVLIFSGGNFGMDTVTGFADGIDLLRLDIASVQTIAQDGANTVITSTAGEITLVNIQASDISDADFIQI